MRKFSKILSLLLLLAIVASVFAVLPAFAEDASETTLQPTTIMDMDDLYNSNFIHGTTVERDGESVQSPSKTKVTDENGDSYLLIESNVTKGSAIGVGTNQAYIQLIPSSSTVLVSGTSYGDKNTDYLVIDLDVSTDSAFLSSINFHHRWSDASGENTQYAGSTALVGSSNSQLYLKRSDTTSYNCYPATDPTDEWVNITLVYDMSGEDSTAWAAYGYIDGYYAGRLTATETEYSFVKMQFLRLTMPWTAVNDYETTKIRNFTVKSFPVGYAGDMNVIENSLGGSGNSLYDIAELNYCLEGANEPKYNSVDAIAKIERENVADPIYIYDPYDLDANFVDNDKVTILDDIAMPIVINANGVNVDSNGFIFNPVNLESITGGAADFDWSTVGYIKLNTVTRAYVGHGTVEEFATAAVPNSSTITAYTYILLADCTYTAVNGSTGVSSKAGTMTVYDANGHTMTFASKERSLAMNGTDVVIRFANGKFSYQGKARDLGMPSSWRFTMVIQNAEYEVGPFTAGAFLDLRGGAVIVKDSHVDFVDDNGFRFNRVPAMPSALVFDGATVTGASRPITFASTLADADQFNLNIRNSYIEATAAVFSGYIRTAGGTFAPNVTVVNSELVAPIAVDLGGGNPGSNKMFGEFTGVAGDANTFFKPVFNFVDTSITATTAFGRIQNYSTSTAYTVAATVNVSGDSTIDTPIMGTRLNAESSPILSLTYNLGEGVKVTSSALKNQDDFNVTWGTEPTFKNTVTDSKYPYVVVGADGYTSHQMADGTLVWDQVAEDNKLLATVTRGAEVINVYDWSDIDASLVANDVVTLYANLFDSLLVDNDVADTVVWIENGYYLEAPTVLDLDALSFVIRDADGNVVENTATTLDEAITAALVDGYTVTLLADGVITANKNLTTMLTLDLNGNKLEMNGIISLKASSAELILKNGTLIQGAEIRMRTADGAGADSKVVYEDIDLSSDTYILNRDCGIIYFDDCNISFSKGYAIRCSTNSANGVSGIVFNGTDLTYSGNSNSAYFIAASNSSSLADYSQYIYARGGKFNLTRALIQPEQASAADAPTTVKHTIVLKDVEYTASSGIIYDRDNAPGKTDDVFDSNNTKWYNGEQNIVDIIIEGSTVSCKAVYYQTNPSIKSTAGAYSYYQTLDRTFIANISLDSASKYYSYVSDESSGVGAFAYKMKENASINVTLEEGAILTTTKVVLDEQFKTDNNAMILPEGCQLVGQSDDSSSGILYVVAKDGVAYSYTAPDKTESTFWWKAGETPAENVMNILPGENTAVNKYVWTVTDGKYVATLVPNFGLQANLTLFSDLYFNVFIPIKDLEAFNEENITVGGVEEGDYIISRVDDDEDGTADRIKIQIRGIAPNEIANTFSFTISFSDAYGNTCEKTKTLSVLDYLTMMLNNTNEDGTPNTDCDGVMAALVDYAIEAYKYGTGSGDGVVPEALAGLVDLEQYKAVTGASDEDIAADNTLNNEIVEDVTLNLSDDIRFIFTVDAAKVGQAVVITIGDATINTTVLEGGTVTFAVKAYELTNSFSITIGEESAGTYSLKAYVTNEKVQSSTAKALADAAWQYVVEAAAYKYSA